MNKWTGKLDKHYLNGKSLKGFQKKFKEIWDGTVESAKSFGEGFSKTISNTVDGALKIWEDFKTGLARKINAVTSGINTWF